MKNIKFQPVIIDHYLPLIKYKTPTEEDKKKYCLIGDSIKELIEKYNVHIIINDYIYLSIRKNGVPVDKALRIKIGGDVYNKIMKANNNVLPRYIDIVDAEMLDVNEIY